MRTRTTVLFALLIGLAGCGKPDEAPLPEPEAPPPVEWNDNVQAAADANNRFALNLYRKLAESEKGKNVFFSPYSAHAALAMTASGANGSTRESMLKVLHLPGEDEKLYAAGDMSRYYDHPRRSFELKVANAIWGQKGRGWYPDWLALQKSRFGSELKEADFQKNPDTERLRINQWVEEQTHNRIKDLLQPGQIRSNTVQVLVNAIYFKGKWVTQFDPKKTRDQTFHLADDRRTQVPMMHGDIQCGYYREEDVVSIVELPYQGNELSMIVMLPRFPDGVPALEKRLSPELLGKWIDSLKVRTVEQVSLPRFRDDSRYELLPYLESLGMTGSDFTRMAPGSMEPITSVTHQAFVEVNEEGTQAAAATAVIRGESLQLPLFVAEHPFLFLIRDVKHGTILFMGRVMNPKE